MLAVRNTKRTAIQKCSIFRTWQRSFAGKCVTLQYNIMMCKCCATVTFPSLRQCHKWVFYDWEPVGTEQEDDHSDLLLERCFVSITPPALVFVYFCPSSGVNKTPLCQRGAWVMRLVSLEALHPTGHGSTSEIQWKWVSGLRILFTLHILYFCAGLYTCVTFWGSIDACYHYHDCTKHFIKQNNNTNAKTNVRNAKYRKNWSSPITSAKSQNYTGHTAR